MMKFRAEYSKQYRASAEELRDALEARVCSSYKPRSDRVSLDAEYDMGDSAYNVADDLESMTNNM